jgi:hypothetical protein
MIAIINKGGWRDLNTGDRLETVPRTLETIDYAIHALKGTSLPFDRQGSRTPKESGSLSIQVEVPGVLNSCTY